jgi:peroxiredoxin Q/BCP
MPLLKVGDKAPAFTALDTRGETVSLSSFKGRPLILYFFHKAFSPNCSTELKGFRDNYDDLRALGFDVLGVSTDSYETQCEFARRHRVSHPMIGDANREVARSYGVLWPLIPFARRVAYVLDGAHVVVAVFRHEFQVNQHLDDILKFAKHWRPSVAVPP